MKTNSIFNKTTSHFFGGLHKVGYVAIALGLFVALSPFLISDSNSTMKAIIVGLVATIVGLILSFTKEGITMNFEKKVYRNYFSFLGLKFGNWKSLPLVTSIKLVHTSFQGRTIANGVNPSLNGKLSVYSLGIFSSNSKPEITIKSEDKDQLSKDAQILSEKFNVTLESQL